jgi:sigma-B regulation protein RsbQ
MRDFEPRKTHTGWVVDRVRAGGSCVPLVGLYTSRKAATAWISERGDEYLAMERSRHSDILRRNNVHIAGSGHRAMIFAHGFGCDQTMWRFVAPTFQQDFKTVVFDHVGSGGSDMTAYRREKYASLQGYASDLIEIGDALDLSDAILVGHSVSAMIGVLASVASPRMFGHLVLIGPSARYIDDIGYVGGFSEDRIGELLGFLEEHYTEWSTTMGPAIMGNPDRPQLSQELVESFCRLDKNVARDFARATFLSDNRFDLPQVSAHALVLQCSEDVIAPIEAGAYVHGSIPGSRMVTLKATGHCPHLSAPHEVIEAIRAFV